MATLAPHDAARWLQCPGSVSLGELAAPYFSESPAAQEGRIARNVALQRLRGLPPEQMDCVTQEMIDAAEVFAADVYQGLRVSVQVERTVVCRPIHPAMIGIPEAWFFDRDAGRLTVWSFRYGHRPVPARDNATLACYAAGILDAAGVTGHSDQLLGVEFRVVQPRAYSAGTPVDTWVGKASDLRGLWNKLRDAAERAGAGESNACCTGPECMRCPARSECKTLARAGWQAAAMVGDAERDPLTSAVLGNELALLEQAAAVLAARIDGLRITAEHLLRQQTPVPGWTLKPGRGATRWNAPIEQVWAMADLLGLELRKPDVPVTPRQAEEMAKKAGIDPSFLAGFTEKVPGELKLSPVTESEVKEAFKCL